MKLMRVPAGKFLMGSTKENTLADDRERLQHTVDIPYDYWMARFPTTNEGYSKYVVAKGLIHPVIDWMQKKDHPVVKISWNDAVAYCQWLNGLLKDELPSGLVFHLPTEAEWEKAARGINGYEWPWGNEFDENKCNSSEGGKGKTTSVGSYSPQGDSPYGCADLAGNVWEWTHSLYKSYPYQAKDGREDERSSDYRVLRGGSFRSYHGDARCATRLRYLPNFINWNFGFRVCVFPINISEL